MHVPDGFLSPRITLPAWGAALPLWAWAARRGSGPSAADSLPVVGSLTALAFVVQGLAIPVPGGTSVHLLGVAVLAVLRGPAVAFVCESLVLALQALILGVGGFTVLGVNSIALGLIGPAAAWLAWKALGRLSPVVAAFAAGWLGMQASSLALALVLGLQHRIDPSYMPVPGRVTLLAMMVPSLTALGVLEGLYTVATLALLRKARLLRAE